MTPPEDYRQLPNINWYPGHMLKAKKELAANLKKVDIVLELRDARLPITSINPDFERILQQKKRIVLFNKTGLAAPDTTKLWKQRFQSEKIEFVFIDVKQSIGIQKILPKAKNLMKQKWENFRKKGIHPPTLRLMVAGIPNVGKSSLINKLVKRHATNIGPRPGVTRNQEWVTLDKNIELLDTPGILWPKVEHIDAGFQLTVTGAIKDSIVGIERLSLYLIRYYQNHFLERLQQYYHLEDDINALAPENVLDSIARKRGYLKSKGQTNIQRTAEALLHDFREGKLGQVTFDHP